MVFASLDSSSLRESSQPKEPLSDILSTDISSSVDSIGEFIKETTVKSKDGNCTLTIKKGIRSLTKEYEALQQITIEKITDDSDKFITGYKLSPEDADFHRDVSLVIAYDDTGIPENVSEKSLFIAIYDSTRGKWKELPSTVDIENSKVSAKIDHLSDVAVMFSTRPASFITSNLTVTPTEVDIGEEVTVSLDVENTGDVAGSYQLILIINSVAIKTKEVSVEGRENEQVSFKITRDKPGVNKVKIDNLSGVFKVREFAPASFQISNLIISPTEADIGDKVNISVAVSNTGALTGNCEVLLTIENHMTTYTKWVPLDGGASKELEFFITPTVSGAHKVDINGVSSELIVREKDSPPPSGSRTWLVVLISIVGVSAMAATIYYVPRLELTKRQ